MTLLFTGTIVVIGLITVIFENGFWIWMCMGILLIVTITTNFLLSRLYKVQKTEKNIIIENMWRERTYSNEALVEIRLIKFIIPYPFNPFVKFSFNDGKSFIGSMPDAFFVYLRSGGIQKYLENIREQWFSRQNR